MKTLSIATAVLAAAVSTASAADMARPYTKAPTVAPIFDWSGVYVGIQGGGGWGRESFTDNSGAGAVISHRPSGGLVGGQLGARWQTGLFVFGIEGTGAWSDIKDSQTINGVIERFKVGSIYTATGQVGYSVDRWLPYVKGGWAGATADYDVNNGATSHSRKNVSGWTVGGGIDYAVAPNWTVGVEYDHFDFNYPGGSSPASNGGGAYIVSNTSRLTADQLVGRVNYKFGWGGPVAAKY